MATVAATLPANPHPLRDPQFRRLWLGSAISLFGDQFYLVALPWVVFQLTGSAVAMGTIMMAAALPRAVLMLMGGAVSDRMSARRIMMTTATARTLLVAAIGVLLWLHILRVWELYLLGFGFGVADAFALPASQTFLPFLVKREGLVAANSVIQTTAQLVTIAGPAPAGIVVKTLGAAPAFIIDAISFLFILGALWKLPDPPVAQISGTKPSVWRSILEGIQYVRRDVPLSSLMLTATVLNFCIAGPIAVGLPYLAASKFGSPTAYAVLVSAAAAGGLLGALLAGVWKSRHSDSRGLHCSGTLSGVHRSTAAAVADRSRSVLNGRLSRADQHSHRCLVSAASGSSGPRTRDECIDVRRHRPAAGLSRAGWRAGSMERQADVYSGQRRNADGNHCCGHAPERPRNRIKARPCGRFRARVTPES